MTWQAQLQADSIEAEQFRQIVEAMLAEKHPDLTVAVEDALALRITLGEASLIWNLDRTYDHTMSSDAEEREGILEGIMGDLTVHLSGTHETEPETRTQRLMPVLRRKDYIQSQPQILFEPFSDELVIAYVIDHESTVEYVMRDNLEELGVEQQNLRELAVSNLLNRLEPRIEEGDASCAMIVCGGTFESSYAIVDEMIDNFASQCDGELLAAFPANDMFIFADTGSEEGVATVIATAKHIVENGDNPLSRELFKRIDGKWVPWTLSSTVAVRDS